MSEPDRFEAQARGMLDTLSRGQWSEKDLIDAVADRLRAAEASALERAAQVWDGANQKARWSAQQIAKKLRSLIPPAAAPAAHEPERYFPGAAELMGEPPVPAAETGKAQHKADCPATHHDPFREELCTCKPAQGAEARKWFWVRAEHPRGAAEEPICHLSDGGALMRCGDYVTGRVVRETPRRDRQCLRCRAYELRATPAPALEEALDELAAVLRGKDAMGEKLAKALGVPAGPLGRLVDAAIARLALLRECEEALSTVGCHPDGEALAQSVLKKLRARAAPPEREGT